MVRRRELLPVPPARRAHRAPRSRLCRRHRASLATGGSTAEPEERLVDGDAPTVVAGVRHDDEHRRRRDGCWLTRGRVPALSIADRGSLATTRLRSQRPGRSSRRRPTIATAIEIGTFNGETTALLVETLTATGRSSVTTCPSFVRRHPGPVRFPASEGAMHRASSARTPERDRRNERADDGERARLHRSWRGPRPDTKQHRRCLRAVREDSHSCENPEVHCGAR